MPYLSMGVVLLAGLAVSSIHKWGSVLRKEIIKLLPLQKTLPAQSTLLPVIMKMDTQIYSFSWGHAAETVVSSHMENFLEREKLELRKGI